MDHLKRQISELAEIMDEFRLAEAEFESDGHRIAFRRSMAPVPGPSVEGAPIEFEAREIEEESAPPQTEVQAGTPVTSPMTGIFYAAQNPNTPPFVKEGGQVTAGDVVGLIEAMKVFNEITATSSGTVLKVVAESGQLVQPGDPLLYIG